MSFEAIRLIPATFRFLTADVVRPRWSFLVASLIAYAGAQILLALRMKNAGPAVVSYGPITMLCLFVVSAPLCRSQVDDDVRLGYAGLWLGKPIHVLDLYFARLCALLAWSVLASAAVVGASSPALVVASGSFLDLIYSFIGLGWVPPILVVLAFLGSTAGARNAALFGYGMLFVGFALEGLSALLPIRGAYEPLRHIFPPARRAVDATELLQSGRLLDALAQLAPLAGYALAVAAVATALTLAVPGRLAAGR